MKKLTLKLDSAKELLSKEQMKKITGGYGSISGCWGPCGFGEQFGTCIPAADTCYCIDPFTQSEIGVCNV